MSQIPLFAGTSETVLVNDELGRIAYTSAFLPAEVARAWFAELREAVTWETQRRQMYDREVDDRRPRHRRPRRDQSASLHGRVAGRACRGPRSAPA